MTNIKALLQDFVDTHVHGGPTPTVREFNVWQLAAEAEKGGFSAMVLKDHFRDPGGSRGVGPRQVIDIAGKMS